MKNTVSVLPRQILCQDWSAVCFFIAAHNQCEPVLNGDGIWVSLLQAVYKMDAPTNLFPSIHCLVSWFSFIGIRGRKSVPKAVQVFFLPVLPFLYAYPQVTKQHYIVDVFGGIAIAEITYYIAFHTNIYRLFKRVFNRYMKCF